MNEIDKAMHAALQQVHPDLVAALEHAVALGGTRSAMLKIVRRQTAQLGPHNVLRPMLEGEIDYLLEGRKP